jgi:hypothetical protein
VSDPADTADVPRSAEPTRRSRRTTPGARRAIVETLVVSLIVGVVLGVVWRLVAPEVEVVVSDGQPQPLPLEVRELFGVDAWFAILGAVTGAVVALVMFTRHRHRPVAALVGLATAGVIGSIVAWQVGVLLGPDALGPRVAEASDGDRLALPLDLDATGVLAGWSIAAVVVVLVMTALTTDQKRANRPDP